MAGKLWKKGPSTPTAWQDLEFGRKVGGGRAEHVGFRAEGLLGRGGEVWKTHQVEWEGSH